MVTVQQIRQGLLKYIDHEIVSKVGGLSKWVVAFSSVSLVDSYLEQFSHLRKMGLMTEDGMVDIDKLYSQMLDVAREKGSVTQHFPLIGDITFSDHDITRLYEFIKS